MLFYDLLDRAYDAVDSSDLPSGRVIVVRRAWNIAVSLDLCFPRRRCPQLEGEVRPYWVGSLPQAFYRCHRVNDEVMS